MILLPFFSWKAFLGVFIFMFNCPGAVTILPTILHLTTSVARELAARTSETKAPTVISACLQSLKLLCTNEMMKEEAVSADWLRLLQSAVATLLHYGKPGQCVLAFWWVEGWSREQVDKKMRWGEGSVWARLGVRMRGGRSFQGTGRLDGWGRVCRMV